MHVGSDCNKCLKKNVCRLIQEYLNKCEEVTDTNTEDFVSELKCKHYDSK